MTAPWVEPYLARIGADAKPPVTPSALAALQRAHLDHVPFENLDIHLGIPIVLDVGRFIDKIVERRRGGFCYELNGAFAALLSELGFAVEMLEARVFDDGRPGIPYDHIVLRVALDVTYLADVGFGAWSRDPLRLQPDIDQRDPAGVYRIDAVEDDSVDVLQDGHPTYRLSLRARALGDFEPGCRYHQTSPHSHFTTGTVCSLPTADGGRVTIRNRTLVTTAGDGTRTERELAADEVGVVLAERFGIILDDPPTGPRR